MMGCGCLLGEGTKYLDLDGEINSKLLRAQREYALHRARTTGQALLVIHQLSQPYNEDNLPCMCPCHVKDSNVLC